MSLVFTAISPFSLLFVLFVISDGQHPLCRSQSLVMALVGYGLALGQDISFYKTEYKAGCICCITRFPIDLHGWTCLSELYSAFQHL